MGPAGPRASAPGMVTSKPPSISRPWSVPTGWLIEMSNSRARATSSAPKVSASVTAGSGASAAPSA